jgi:hypothetical protein
MIELMGKFNVSESFYQRLTNILPKDFQLKKIFFFDCLIKRRRYLSDKKELHITNQQDRMLTKWMNFVADGFLKTIEQSIEQNNSHFFDAQISRYENSGNNFLFLIRNSRSFQKIAWSISVGNLDYPEREEKSNS